MDPLLGNLTWSDEPLSRPEPGALVTEHMRLVEPLAEGGMGTVWIAEHLGLGMRVAVKFVLRVDDPTSRERLVREAELAARVVHPYAVRIVDHGLTDAGLPYLAMELLDGETLRERLDRDGAQPRAHASRIVGQVAEALDAVHALGIIHRDVKPGNVFVLAGPAHDPPDIKLIDFGVAKPTEGVATTLTRVGQIVGTPLYMTPEHLLHDRPVDRYADLWGLALVAYELLVGQRVFSGDSVATAAVNVILRRYEPATALDRSLPADVDAFFEKALHADPASRFATAEALAHAFVEAIGSTAPATPRAPELRLPDKIYGREAELDRLQRAYDQASTGHSRVVLLSGYSGIGKSALVQELRRRVGSLGASVAFGKFDAYDRGVPYKSVIQAVRELIRGAVVRGDATVVEWRSRVRAALGSNGYVLTDVIVELEDVIGPQLRPPSSGTPADQRVRFQIAMQRLLNAMASSRHPVVLFLDDLQWADLSSLDLIAALATDPLSRNVLLVGAYRDNEVGGAHPLVATRKRMAASGRLDEVVLGPLDEDAVLELATDALPGLHGRLRLAAACHARSRGNAFFLRRFLETLGEQGLVRFDTDLGVWTWDPAGVDAMEMPADVVDFVSAEIARMGEPVRESLGVAACISERFGLGTLAHVLGTGPRQALERIRAGLANGLLNASVETDATGNMVFTFAHDRVRQAARSTVDNARVANIHRKVGLFLLEHLSGAERERRLFEVVEHLNRGPDDARSPAERIQLRGLNVEAARRALRSAAFEVGDRFLRQARALLGTDAWSADRAQTLEIHVEGARAAYLVGDHETMDELINEAVAHGRDALERTRAREVRIQAHVSHSRFAEALELARLVLADLGLAVPERATPADVEQALGDTLGAIQTAGEQAIAELPLCEDPVVLARLRVQTVAMSSAYLAEPSLLPLLACSIVRTTLDHGVGPQSPYGLACLGLVLNAVGLYAAAPPIGRIALSMLDRVDDRAIQPRTLHVLAAHVMLYAEPMAPWVTTERKVMRLGFDLGDLEYAAWGIHGATCNALYAGAPLDELAAAWARDEQTLHYHQQHTALGVTVPFGRAIDCLRADPANPPSLSGDDYDEEGQLTRYAAGGFRGGVYVIGVMGGWIRYLFGDAAGALERFDRVEAFADGAAATYHLVWWSQFRALALLGQRTSGDGAREAVASQLAHLEALAAVSLVNHGHRPLLVEGELARVEGRFADARAAFDQAAASAAAHGFTHDEALAHELAGRACAEAGDPDAAETARGHALGAYTRWGAHAKVAHLRG